MASPATKEELFFHLLRRARQLGWGMAALHGWDSYPALGGFDADVIADWRPWSAWQDFLRDGLNGTGWRFAMVVRRGHLLSAFLFRDGADFRDQTAFLQLDLHRALTARAIPLFETAWLLEAARERDGMLWVEPSKAAAARALEALVAEGRQPGPLADAVRREALGDCAVGAPHGVLLAAAAWRAIRRRPGLLARVIGAKLVDGLAAWVSPPGAIWVCCGPDGAGKSTALDSVAPGLRRRVCTDVTRFHTRPFLLAGRGGENAAHRDASGTAAPAAPGRLRSMLRLAVAATDFVLGYWVRVRPELVRGHLVLFDRYVPDYLVDPVRRGIAGLTAAVAAMARWTPAAHGTLVIVAPPATLRARKDELSAAEAARQVAAYRALAEQLPGATLLDSSQLDEAALADRMARTIIQGVAGRCAS